MKLSLILALGWSVIIILLSSVSGTDINSGLSLFEGADKVGHFAIYLICFLVWVKYLDGVYKPKLAVVYALVISILLGIIMEFCQFYFFEDRKFEFYDIIANIGGSLVGYLIYKNLNNQT